MTQPEALRLADLLDLDPMPMGWCYEAAAELRRLHAEVEAQRGTIAQFHHAVAGAGWHPGRTDDLLTDIIRDKGQELRRLHAEVERLSLDSTHSCHAECQRPLCKLTRERDALLERADTLQRWYDQQLDRLAAVEAQRDALLEALRKIGKYTGEGSMYTTPWRDIVADLGQTARAAIKTVEEGK